MSGGGVGLRENIYRMCEMRSGRYDERAATENIGILLAA